MLQEEALKKLKNIGKVIIKPSVDTSSGSNVCLLNIENGIDIISNKTINEILEKYKKNYMIQEVIKQHECLQKLNSSSVNTIRINTYVCDEKVYSSPVAIRIGRNGSIVDNAHAGGIQVGIKNDSTLRKYAFTEYGEKFEEHPDTKVKFENYKILRVQDMIEFAKRYHYKIPHMGIIAWDFTLDKDENIVLIETNITSPTVWFPQYTNGESFFGENTEKMIKKLKEKRID